MRGADRLFQIVQILRARRVTTAAQLAETLEVSERTVYRDVRDLMISGVPIEGEAGVGYALPRSFDLPPLMFNQRELESLVLGARLVKSWSDAELAEAADSALVKIEAVLPERLHARLDEISLFAPNYRGERRDEEASQRTVRPIGLFFWGYNWTLTAWCELRDDFRSFRVDRIERLALQDDTFEPEPGKTLEDFLEQVTAPVEGDGSL
ncbi:MAG: YafY family transcriptional regulator [Deltaproteobacteria bacterium]|nr:YafY family transcriptional regulator [Deltaproteobacteria bacterium]MBW2446174.1 YafY family transcriptional regulator [Deltaproteobacteria bacterium]